MMYTTSLYFCRDKQILKTFERFGLQLISVDVRKGELVIKHPGLTIEDIDKDRKWNYHHTCKS